MTLYTRPQLVVLLIVVLVAGTGLAVGHWRRTHPDMVARLEMLDRAAEQSPADPGDARGPDPDPASTSSPPDPSSPLRPRTQIPAGADTEAGSRATSASADAAPRARAAGTPADPSAWRRSPPKETPAQPLDINRATEDELRTLPGIGGVLAARIVQARERDGPFASLDDLRRVPGLGRAKLDRIAAAVTLPP